MRITLGDAQRLFGLPTMFEVVRGALPGRMVRPLAWAAGMDPGQLHGLFLQQYANALLEAMRRHLGAFGIIVRLSVPERLALFPQDYGFVLEPEVSWPHVADIVRRKLGGPLRGPAADVVLGALPALGRMRVSGSDLKGKFLDRFRLDVAAHAGKILRRMVQ